MFSQNREPQAQKKKKKKIIGIFKTFGPHLIKLGILEIFPNLNSHVNKKFGFLFFIFIYSEVAI